MVLQRILTAFALVTLGFGYVSGEGRKSNQQDGPAGRQRVADKAKSQKQRPTVIKNLADDALNVPAEFGADVLIRLAESDKVVDRAWKRELLEEAFRRASDAQQPTKRSYLGGEVDTRTGYLSMAFDLKLDALSLRSHSVRVMLLIDARRARELFGEISPKLQLPALRCDDSLIYDVSDFYDTLNQVIEKSFSPAEKSDNQHVYFMQPYIDGMSSPTQVGPVAKSIVAIKSSPEQFAALVHAFSVTLKNVAEDDRSFSYWPTQYSALRHVGELVKACEKQNVPTRELLESLRAYIVGRMSADRCADNQADINEHLLNYIHPANKTIFSSNPITDDEVRPFHILGAAEMHHYWRSSKAKRFLTEVKALRFGTGDKPLTAAEKENPEWRLQLAEFLNDIAEWKASDEKSEADYFHQKSVLYRALSEVIPAGAQRDVVLGEYAAFLSSNYGRQESYVEWFLHARDLMKRVSSAPSGERSKTSEAVRKSGNAVLRLYDDLNNLVPPP